MNRTPWGAALSSCILGLAIVSLSGSASAQPPTRAELEREFEEALANRSAVQLVIGRAGKIRLLLNPADPMVTKRLVEEHAWEPNETNWFLKRVRSGYVVVDVGANVGYYTLIAGKLVGETGRVYAFEPDPVAFALLEKNVALNGLSNVVLERKAASNEAGSIRLYLSDDNKGDHRIYQTDEARKSIEIEAVALDEYFEERASKIDFVKIDTQGAEAVIVDGMKRIIAENHAIEIVIEFWPSALKQFGRNSDELLATFEAAGFRFFNLGIWGQPKPLRIVEPAELKTKLTVENERFTNLLLMRELPKPHQRDTPQAPR